MKERMKERLLFGLMRSWWFHPLILVVGGLGLVFLVALIEIVVTNYIN